MFQRMHNNLENIVNKMENIFAAKKALFLKIVNISCVFWDAAHFVYWGLLELCHAKTGLKTFFIVKPKEVRAGDSPLKPIFLGMTSTTKSNLRRLK